MHVPFIVMEYVEGHTVRDILRDGQAVPIDEAVEITAGVLAALEYSHHAGIVHRDIKPANVMITPTGAVKVMDFGIARAVADSAATMTQTQAVIGTAQYLSPEQARGETVDARSDLYSTGCLLYELLTGRPPFIGDSPVAVAYQHVREAPATPSAVAPDVPEVLDRITLKALAKDRDERYSSAAEFRSDLENAVRGGSITAPALGVAAAAAGLGAGVAAADMRPTMVESATQVMSPAGPPSPWATTAAPAVPPNGEGPGDPEEEKKSRKGLMWTLIAVGVLALAAIATILLLNRPPAEPETVEVPTVQEGMTEDEARALFEGVDLEFNPLLEQSDAVPEGQFVRQSPAGGEEVKPGETVDVWFSTGPDSVQVPELAGLTQDEARQALADAGLEVGNVTPEDSATVEQDVVTRTEPAANQSVAAGSAVTLFISSGRVELPDLTSMNRQEAEQTVRDLGLNPVIEETESDEAEGTVLSQRPNPGSVQQGSDVTIVVAIPPATETTRVPTNLAGMTEDQAVEALNGAQLNRGQRQTQASDQWPAGTVIGSDPGGGTEVEVGTNVSLIVSTGPGPSNGNGQDDGGGNNNGGGPGGDNGGGNDG
ncbi:Stk1 family PASTA domain-containing Ser/Thr kinase [Cellulosimicrobium sp. CUA-896]|uniref:Stk1 family PASTA domain-containing Ser/Thr kinase n=1 Tax=Cellulosimicrobium sp. CUA-896 TaxID=1517881 RepID=UPI003514DFC9